MTAPHSIEKKPTLMGLHLVRGICALAVMVYHYLDFAGVGTFHSVGTYGVYIFFVLSGFALMYVYGDDPIDETRTRNFYISRIFRVLPLYAVVATYQLWVLGISDRTVSLYILNVSLMFGFASPGVTSLVGGGWSIGIEAVFYLLFPAILLVRSTVSLGVLFLLAAVLHHFMVGASYADPRMSSNHWASYTQAPTFFVYFIGGAFIAKLYPVLKRHADGRATWRALFLLFTLAVMSAIFILPQMFGLSRQELLSGLAAQSLIAGSLLVVASAALSSLNGLLAKAAGYIGDISYSLYLIHMPVWWRVEMHIDASIGIRAVIAIVLSIAVATMSYQLIERPTRSLQKHFRKPSTRTLRDTSSSSVLS